MNFCVDQSRPACVRRLLSGTLLSFWRRVSRSFSDVSTCSRRERWVLSAWRATGSDFATDARRLSAFFSPERKG